MPEHFNDDKIGRVLDLLYELGLDKIFLAISLRACQIYGIDKSYSHLDSSSISVEGDYLIYPSEILTRYKGQQSGETGFRFLKDPLFFADAVFLKNPSRIEAMAMLMGWKMVK